MHGRNARGFDQNGGRSRDYQSERGGNYNRGYPVERRSSEHERKSSDGPLSPHFEDNEGKFLLQSAVNILKCI